jgi:hypothetical protein
MRIAISAVASMCVAFVATASLAQPAPQPPPAGQPAQPHDAAAAKDQPPAGAGSTSAALAPPETPPAPPPPGTSPTATPKAPGAPPQTFGDETGMNWRPGANQDPIAGWHGMFFLRDHDDNFRLTPTALLQLDFNSFFGSAVNGKSTAAKDGAGMPPRFFVRRFRLGIAGEFLKRWSYKAEADFAASTDNADGAGELFAAPPGVTPTGSTARYRPVQGAAVDVNLADVWINYSLCPCLNFQFGQFRTPFSLENRTNDWQLPFMERNIAIRGFAVPTARETGLMLWGDIGDKILSYELMVAGGDGQNRPEVDTAADFIGRLMARPLGSVKLLKDAEIGVSARHGERDPEAVGYNYPAVTTNQGFVLFNPSYIDSANRRVKVIPSGAQNLIGGELRLPIGPVDIQGEGYYLANHTREAIDGYQFTNTERLGTLKGGTFYAEVTWWVLGDSFISDDPGYQRPAKLNLRKKVDIKRGLAVTGLAAGVIGDYDGNSRGGTDDPRTPGSTGNAATDFQMYQFGLSASYWHSKWVRMELNYALYFTPKSGSTDNLAVVPGNVFGGGDAGAHLLHELGARLQLWF